jgi:hypothetical protein
MSKHIYLEGPAGGPGGRLIELDNPEAQPQPVDSGSENPAGLTVYEIIAKEDCRIREIIVNAGDCIDALTVAYAGLKDHGYGTFRMGGTGGQERFIQLGDGEYISRISGEYSYVVKNLEIKTSHNITYAFGTPGDVRFQYTAPEGHQIIGFWGGVGSVVDRIGVAIKQLEKTDPVRKPAPKKKAAPPGAKAEKVKEKEKLKEKEKEKKPKKSK